MKRVLAALCFLLSGAPVFALPSLPDLSVTHIERLPRYPAYHYEYPDGVPQMMGYVNGHLVPLTPEMDAQIQRYPEIGETVEFIGHIRNAGFTVSAPATARWLLAGEVVGVSDVPALGPYEETTLLLKRPWPGEDATVRLEVLGAGEQISTENDWVEDVLGAHALWMAIHENMVSGYRGHPNVMGTYCFEDWMTWHFRRMNQYLEEAVWPRTPHGALDRVRIDRIEVVPSRQAWDQLKEGGGAVHGFDGAWFVGDVPSWFPNHVAREDTGLIHELMHQLGVIDNYRLNMIPARNHARDENGNYLFIGYQQRQPGLMGGGRYVDEEGRTIERPADRPMICEHVAAGLNDQRGRRRGGYGLHLLKLPARNALRILNNAGEPAPGVEVRVYESRWREEFIRDSAVAEAITNVEGIAEIGANPFGKVDVVGKNGRLFARLRKDGHAEYHWLQIFDMNFAYWDGFVDSATYTFRTHFPPASAPPAIAHLDLTIEYPGRNRLEWAPVTGAAKIRVYRNDNSLDTCSESPFYRVVELPGTATQYIDTFTSVENSSYMVTAVDAQGRESDWSNRPVAPNILVPGGVFVGADNEAWVLDREAGARFRLHRMLADGNFGIWEYNAYENGENWLRNACDCTIGPRGRLWVTDTPGAYRPRHEIQIFDLATGVRVQTIGGDEGGGDNEFRHPHGITTDGSDRVFVVDSGNNRIQVFDDKGSLLETISPDNYLAEPAFAEPQGLDWHDGRLALADTGNGRIVLITENPASPFPANWHFRSLGGFQAPTDVAFSPGGNLLVCETGANQVRYVEPDGTVLATWTPAEAPGYPPSPNWIDCSSEGLIVLTVGSAADRRIQRTSMPEILGLESDVSSWRVK